MISPQMFHLVLLSLLWTYAPFNPVFACWVAKP